MDFKLYPLDLKPINETLKNAGSRKITITPPNTSVLVGPKWKATDGQYTYVGKNASVVLTAIVTRISNDAVETYEENRASLKRNARIIDGLKIIQDQSGERQKKIRYQHIREGFHMLLRQKIKKEYQ